MLLEDKIYGKLNIDSDAIKDIIKSEPIQRLKGISQFGIPSKYYHFKEVDCYSRFEHSVGVMLLLKSLNAPEKEQIAGLIHDVSHTAFSHVIDWVIGEGNREDYQDEQHQDYVFKSGLAGILKKYNYNPNEISNESNFPLLEQEIPNLYADRIDYLLRELPLKEARSLFNHLTVKNNRIVFDNEESALKFALSFLDKQMNHWGGYEAVVRYRLFANILRRALDKNILNFNDFWKSEEFIIRKLEDCKDEKIKKSLSLLKKKSLKSLPRANEVEYKKFRYVDPKFISSKGLVRVSDSNSKFKTKFKKVREENKRGINLPKNL